MARVSLQCEYERSYTERGLFHIIGCDEVGRGCIAGPVVAAAVLFDWRNAEEMVDLGKRVLIADSKVVSPLKREEADREIRKLALKVGVGVLSPETIDKINILQASLQAMKQAVMTVQPRGDSTVLVDGNQRIPGVDFDQKTIIDGDAKVFSIAAASIVAKVYRDRLMAEYHKTHPEYGWDQNKGYGTPSHQKAVKEFGLTPLHRKTFCHI